MKHNNYTTPKCCDRPNVANLDHKKTSPSDWYNPVLMVNRMCLRCKAHWYGPIGQVSQYTGKQWDVWINEAAA